MSSNIVLRCFVSSASVIRHFNTQKNYDDFWNKRNPSFLSKADSSTKGRLDKASSV